MLLATRFGALMVMSTLIGSDAVQPTLRDAIVMALATCFSPIVPVHAWDAWQVISALDGEVALGATMVLGLGLAFAALASACGSDWNQIGY